MASTYGKIISAFPGTGKSRFVKSQGTNRALLDSDSSTFSKDKFPENYVDHIEKAYKSGKIIFVSSHEAVRDEMKRRELPYTIVYPNSDLKEEYIDRYMSRGSPIQFVTLLDSKWNEFLDSCHRDTYLMIPTVVLEKAQTIASRIIDILFT